jgi:hypothetical protein
METTWLEVGGVLIRSPVTAGTNLILATQCIVAFMALRNAGFERGRWWGFFFLMMAVSTLAGALKHGARHLLVGDAFVTMLAISNVATAAAIYFAQRATIEAWAGGARAGLYRYLAALQLGVFATANAVAGPGMTFLIGATVVGLVPVLVTEGLHRRERPGAVWVSAGLFVSISSGLVYVFDVSPHPWFNHIDVAHVIMGVSLAMIFVGVRNGGGAAWS